MSVGYVFTLQMLTLPVYAFAGRRVEFPEQTVPSVYPKCLKKRWMVHMIPTESLLKRRFRAVWDGWFGGNSPNSCRRPRQLLSLWQETNIGCEGARVVSWKYGCTDGRTDGLAMVIEGVYAHLGIFFLILPSTFSIFGHL